MSYFVRQYSIRLPQLHCNFLILFFFYMCIYHKIGGILNFRCEPFCNIFFILVLLALYFKFYSITQDTHSTNTYDLSELWFVCLFANFVHLHLCSTWRLFFLFCSSVYPFAYSLATRSIDTHTHYKANNNT